MTHQTKRIIPRPKLIGIIRNEQPWWRWEITLIGCVLLSHGKKDVNNSVFVIFSAVTKNPLLSLFFFFCFNFTSSFFFPYSPHFLCFLSFHSLLKSSITGLVWCLNFLYLQSGIPMLFFFSFLSLLLFQLPAYGSSLYSSSSPLLINPLPCPWTHLPSTVSPTHRQPLPF